MIFQWGMIQFKLSDLNMLSPFRILSVHSFLLTSSFISIENLSSVLNFRRREKLTVWRGTFLMIRQLILMCRKCNRDVLIQQRDRRTDGTNADNVSRGNKTRTKLAWLDLISPSGFLRDATSGNLQSRGILGASGLRRRCDYYQSQIRDIQILFDCNHVSRFNDIHHTNN